MTLIFCYRAAFIIDELYKLPQLIYMFMCVSTSNESNNAVQHPLFHSNPFIYQIFHLHCSIFHRKKEGCNIAVCEHENMQKRFKDEFHIQKGALRKTFLRTTEL